MNALTSSAAHTVKTAPWISRLAAGVAGRDQRGEFSCNARVRLVGNGSILSQVVSGRLYYSAPIRCQAVRAEN
jgi:hypothetical protein